eukprot:ANDGO_04147.mRNA.1 hypothetical protein
MRNPGPSVRYSSLRNPERGEAAGSAASASAVGSGAEDEQLTSLFFGHVSVTKLTKWIVYSCILAFLAAIFTGCAMNTGYPWWIYRNSADKNAEVFVYLNSNDVSFLKETKSIAEAAFAMTFLSLFFMILGLLCRKSFPLLFSMMCISSLFQLVGTALCIASPWRFRSEFVPDCFCTDFDHDGKTPVLADLPSYLRSLN